MIHVTINNWCTSNFTLPEFHSRSVWSVATATLLKSFHPAAGTSRSTVISMPITSHTCCNKLPISTNRYCIKIFITLTQCLSRISTYNIISAGFPLFYWKKIQNFSRTFQDPHKNFSRTFTEPMNTWISRKMRKNNHLLTLWH